MVQMALPGGAHINQVDVHVIDNETIKITWDCHHGLFVSSLVTAGRLRQDARCLAAHQAVSGK